MAEEPTFTIYLAIRFSRNEFFATIFKRKLNGVERAASFLNETIVRIRQIH